MDLGIANTRFAEHFAWHSDLSLSQLCDEIRIEFGLPDFVRDSENETEWGQVVHDGLEYNVSRPYRVGTLQKWDSSVPEGCNVGFTLSISLARARPTDPAESSAELVPRVGQVLADLLGVPVHHHRTWLRPGENVSRDRVFVPRR